MYSAQSHMILFIVNAIYRNTKFIIIYLFFLLNNLRRMTSFIMKEKKKIK